MNVSLDMVSKYLFMVYLPSKKREEVKRGFYTLLSKIEKERENNVFSLGNSRMRFYGDFGWEFRYEEVKEFLEIRGIPLFQIGTPGFSHAYSIERVIKVT